VLDARGELSATLKRTGIPLGMKPDTVYVTTSELALAPGSLVLLLTDGLEETSGPDGSLFGLDRILEVVRKHQGRSAREIVQTLYEEVRNFAGQSTQTDDITSIVVKCLAD
jgi:sigma-B regulation protein RsbU (phosphoserine phosphatase)